MTWYVTSTSGVTVLEPGPSHFSVLFVDDMFVVGHISPKGSYHVNATGSRADTYDPDMFGSPERLLSDNVGWVCCGPVDVSSVGSFYTMVGHMGDSMACHA